MAKKAYNVTIVRYGSIPVWAENESEAMEIADRQKTDTVNWSDDWMPTDADVDEDLTYGECITKAAF